MSTPDETYRATMRIQTPKHGPATLIVTRQGSRTWLTLDGSIRTTAALTDQQVTELTHNLHASAQDGGTPHRTELPELNGMAAWGRSDSHTVELGACSAPTLWSGWGCGRRGCCG